MAARLVRTFLTLLPLLVTAQAATITYTATNLADVTPGEDLWRYDYVVSGGDFLHSEFFDL